MTNIQLVWQLIIDKIKHTTQTQRAVLAIWFISIVLGIALTVAIVLLLSIQSLTIQISLLACGLIALTSYFVSISLYRSLKVNEDFTEEDKNGFLIDRRDRLIGQHGWRYLTWFIGHSFSWLTVCLGIATLLVNMFGLRPFSLAISAVLLTCGICSLFGVILFAKRPLLLGICWQQIDWRQVADWWELASVTLFLRERHKQIAAQELQRPNSTYRKIIAILDSEPVPSESVGSKVELWEQGSFSHNWWREQWRRVRALYFPFLATLLLALPLFIILRPSISDTAVTLTQKYGTSTAEYRPDDTTPDGASTNPETASTAVANNDAAETEAPNFEGDDGNQESDNTNTTNEGDETDGETGSDGRTPGSEGIESEQPNSETNSEAGTTSESSSSDEDSNSESNGSEPGASSDSSPEDAGDTPEESGSSEAETSSESPSNNASGTSEETDSSETDTTSETSSEGEGNTSEETGGSETDTSSETSSETESDASDESGSSEQDTSSESAPESDASEEGGSSETDASPESPAESESETSEESGDSENGQPNDEGNSNGNAEPGAPAEDAGDGVEESDGPSSPEPGNPQQNGENDGISSDFDDSGDFSSTPGVAETFVNEPPIPSGSEQRIDIELPPLQMNSGLGDEDSPEATAVPPETDENPPGFRRYPQPPKTTPMPSQRTPNWIRILFIN